MTVKRVLVIKEEDTSAVDILRSRMQSMLTQHKISSGVGVHKSHKQKKEESGGGHKVWIKIVLKSYREKNDGEAGVDDKEEDTSA
jgi:hypothetical protein